MLHETQPALLFLARGVDEIRFNRPEMLTAPNMGFAEGFVAAAEQPTTDEKQG
jgi:hypothetical protein